MSKNKSNLKIYLRILTYLKPYVGSFIGSIVFLLLFNVFMLTQLGLIQPFLKTLFTGNSEITEKVNKEQMVTDFNSLVNSNELPDSIKANFTNYIDSVEVLLEQKPQKTEDIKDINWLDKKKAEIENSFNEKVSEYIDNSDKINVLAAFCIALIIVTILKNMSQYLQFVISAHYLYSIINDIRKQLFSHIHCMSISFFNRNKVGNLISRVTNDVTQMSQSIAASITDILRDSTQVVVLILYLIFLNYKLTLYIALVAPFILVVMATIGRYLRKYSTRAQERMADLNIILQETFSGVRVIKGFGKSSFEVNRFNKVANQFLKARMKMFRVNKLAGPFNELVGTLIAVVILWFAGKQVILHGTFAPEEFIAYIVTLTFVMNPLRKLSNHYAKIQQGIAAAVRVFNILDEQPEITNSPNAHKIENFTDNIEINDMSFRYEGAEKNALSNISLTLKKGQNIALVGQSGAGKSTLADMLIRFYDTTEGDILIDNSNIKDIELDSLKNLFGIVTQDTILFNETVAANIAYGESEPDRERILEAAKTANAMPFINRLPDGIDSVIGDRGDMLSGGERQRLAIARAIYKNPQILIFDEATSSLDTESERLVQQAIDQLLKGRTAVIIAHRLSTIVNAHKIVVLQNGHIQEIGTHEELLAKNGIYKELYNNQFSS